MFAKTLKDGLTIDGRTYPAGSVVETHKHRVEDLVRRKHAERHTGPASEPDPPKAPRK